VAPTRDTVLKDKSVSATPPASVLSEPRATPAPLAQRVVEPPLAEPFQPESKPALQPPLMVTSPVLLPPDPLLLRPRSGPGFAAGVPADPADQAEAAKSCALSLGISKETQEWLETVKTHHGPRAGGWRGNGKSTGQISTWRYQP
jgi:hypothetical protein